MCLNIVFYLLHSHLVHVGITSQDTRAVFTCYVQTLNSTKTKKNEHKHL